MTNATIGTGFATIPSASGAAVPQAVQPFVPRSYNLGSNTVSAPAFGVVMAPALRLAKFKEDCLISLSRKKRDDVNRANTRGKCSGANAHSHHWCDRQQGRCRRHHICCQSGGIDQSGKGRWSFAYRCSLPAARRGSVSCLSAQTYGRRTAAALSQSRRANNIRLLCAGTGLQPVENFDRPGRWQSRSSKQSHSVERLPAGPANPLPHRRHRFAQHPGSTPCFHARPV